VQVYRDDTDSVVGPVTIFDGWHRAKAWSDSGGGPRPLIAEIIKTRGPLVGVFAMGAAERFSKLEKVGQMARRGDGI
jgi:hypothetical protein